MAIERYQITVVTLADGTKTAYFPDHLRGRILHISYTKVDYAAGIDFTITTDKTGQAVWSETDCNASKAVSPRQATHDVAGVASLYAGSGEPVEDHIYVADERIKVVIAQGGVAKTGTFQVVIG